MSAKSARREYLQAVAEFQRGWREFARCMERVLESPEEPGPEDLGWMARELGASKPAKRAPRRVKAKRNGAVPAERFRRAPR